MAEYNIEEKKIKEVKQQLYRDFASKYSEIQKSNLSESEKQAQIEELFESISRAMEILGKTRSLSEISAEDKEDLGIKEPNETPNVDTNLIDTLVSIYSKRAKMPSNDYRVMGTEASITLREAKELEDINTTAFEEELRRYFTEHYYDLLSVGYNYFLSDTTSVKEKDSLFNSGKNGELTEIAIKHNLDPKKFSHFGYKFTIQDGLISEEDKILGRTKIFYANPSAINQRIFDLYSQILFKKTEGKNYNLSNLNVDDIRRLKNAYVTYSEKNGIQIENPDTLETLPVDMEKVQGLARYINRVINSQEGIDKDDYTALISDDIVSNYSKIMNLIWYNFRELESVMKINKKGTYFDGLDLSISEDSIIRDDEFDPDIAYGTPEFVIQEYQKIMEEVRRLHQTNAFQEGCLDIEKITTKKQAYRRYIQENGIDGVDISISKVEIDHNKTEMIADAIMRQYGEECEDPEAMRGKILRKLEDNWAEIVTEAQVVSINRLFSAELDEMEDFHTIGNLYVKDDFVYLEDDMGDNSQVIYATQAALAENLADLDRKIADRRMYFEEERTRESLVKYAKEQGFDIDIQPVERLEAKAREEANMFSFGRGVDLFQREAMLDDPTARQRIKLDDSIMVAVFKMSEMSVDATKVIAQLMQQDEAGYMLLLGLDDMNIRGTQISRAYKYLYNEDPKKFAAAIKRRDKDMIDFINEELAVVGGEKAVQHGASFDRSKDPNKYRFTEKEVEELKVQKQERIERERQIREKLIANNPAKKKRLNEKRREEREAKRQAYRAALVAKGKKSIGELDEELTQLREKESQAKGLYEQYNNQLPSQSHEEL